jgi:hypothetical protein
MPIRGLGSSVGLSLLQYGKVAKSILSRKPPQIGYNYGDFGVLTAYYKICGEKAAGMCHTFTNLGDQFHNCRGYCSDEEALQGLCGELECNDSVCQAPCFCEFWDRDLTVTKIHGSVSTDKPSSSAPSPTPSATPTSSPTAPPTILVEVDVRPGCLQINGNNGNIPVTIVGQSNVNCHDIDTKSLSFNGLLVSQNKKGKYQCHMTDTNGDGMEDITCQFEDDESHWQSLEGDSISISGETMDGTGFMGRCTVYRHGEPGGGRMLRTSVSLME